MDKAERSATEPVEPRAETKGNANRQSTHRTQSRASVSQALERVRKAASKTKKEKFTALLHHIGVEHLEMAFFELQENAAAGVDGLILLYPSVMGSLKRPRLFAARNRRRVTSPPRIRTKVSNAASIQRSFAVIGCSARRGLSSGN
jgi:hypothetical protein